MVPYDRPIFQPWHWGRRRIVQNFASHIRGQGLTILRKVRPFGYPQVDPRRLKFQFFEKLFLYDFKFLYMVYLKDALGHIEPTVCAIQPRPSCEWESERISVIYYTVTTESLNTLTNSVQILGGRCWKGDFLHDVSIFLDQSTESIQ